VDESRDTPYEMLRSMEGTHVCAQCGARLVTVWSEEKAVSQLICSKDHAHVGVKRIESNTTLLKRGELDTAAGPGRQADLERVITQGGGVHTLMAGKDVATGKELSDGQIMALALFADSVGLKLNLGHVCLYFGQPYVTIDGYYYLKNQLGLTFRVYTLPMNQDERKLYQVTEGSHAFLSFALGIDGLEIARGIGIITPEELNEKSWRDPSNSAAPVVHDKPQRMAEKRAEWQLMKKMVPLGAVAAQPESTLREPSPKAGEIQADIESLYE